MIRLAFLHTLEYLLSLAHFSKCFLRLSVEGFYFLDSCSNLLPNFSFHLFKKRKDLGALVDQRDCFHQELHPSS